MFIIHFKLWFFHNGPGVGGYVLRGVLALEH